MSGTAELTLFQLNDSHGYIAPHPEWFWDGAAGAIRTAGGHARIAALIAAERRRHPGAVLALDNGDTLHGTYPVVHSEGEALLPILNAMGLDGMTAHWEFAYGPARFKALAQRLNYPMLAINCYEEASGELAYPPYVVYEAAGLRVGVIGIAATIVDKTMPPSFSKGLRFTLGNEELPGHISHLRQEERADLIVVVSHLGFPQEVRLAEEVEGIDVLLSGHTHNRIYRPVLVNGAIIIQSGCHGSFLGRLDLQLEGGKVVDWRHALITVTEDLPEDPVVRERVEAALATDRSDLAEQVGETRTPLHRYTVLEAPMDNLLLQALQSETGAEVAFSNGWRYGAPIPPGPITLNDLWNIIPVNPPVSTCDLTGEEIWDMMEENLEHTFARNPYDQMGGYVKRCLGLNLYAKIENPAGQRIQQIFVGGRPLRREQVYHAAYVTSQGVPKEYGAHHEQIGVRAIDALRRYLAQSGPVSAEIRGSIVAV
ncbi:MAG: bifunctional metallophosphatase/5'-nucleotidase [Chloroflexi bacterium]|nr:bifunctional metallophosphatase/5'-nucleotidase [Chloroflexota bacterium]